MVDSGEHVSAIKEVPKEVYGGVPYPAVQTGNEHPQIIGITLPLHLEESQFPSEFQVVQNLAYDVIHGRDFLQSHRAIIELCNNTIIITETENPQSQESSTAVPTTETFTPQEKNVETRETAFAGYEGSVK